MNYRQIFIWEPKQFENILPGTLYQCLLVWLPGWSGSCCKHKKLRGSNGTEMRQIFCRQILVRYFCATSERSCCCCCWLPVSRKPKEPTGVSSQSTRESSLWFWSGMLWNQINTNRSHEPSTVPQHFVWFGRRQQSPAAAAAAALCWSWFFFWHYLSITFQFWGRN